VPRKQKQPKELRFAWKNKVRHAHNLSRGARQFAAYMVDEYLYTDTSECFASNETLADALGVSVRTIQRYIEELKLGGWIDLSKRRRLRRIIRPSYRCLAQHDKEHDSPVAASMPPMSSEHDMNVAPYMNQQKKQNTGAGFGSQVVGISILKTEEVWLENWKHWIECHTKLAWASLLPRLWNGTAYDFPMRHPPDDAVAEKQARDFFEFMMNSNRYQ
jgi:biotin operon repressor